MDNKSNIFHIDYTILMIKLLFRYIILFPNLKYIFLHVFIYDTLHILNSKKWLNISVNTSII